MGMRASRAAKIAISACLAVVPAPAAPAGQASAAPATKFYPGIAESQSMRAHEALRAFHDGNLARALDLLRKMDAQEEREDLAPLSRLLQTAMAGLYLERDDARDAEEKARLNALVDSASAKGLARCAGKAGGAEKGERAGSAPVHAKAGTEATCLLIEGGILGFRAILKLNVDPPLEVLDDGLDAVSRLEEALARDSSVRDAHMGLGIFNVVGASASPRVARAILRAAGHGVDKEAGLAHLRRSGYEGQYTSSASQFYLIRFLSPYDEELVREKREIFRSLREAYPRSPLPLFLQTHEAICFRPGEFEGSRAALAKGIRSVEAHDYAGARYLNLAKWQYTLLDSLPGRRLAPDTAFDLGGYAFYPAFVKALRLRGEILRAPAPNPADDSRLKALAKLRKSILAKLRESALSPRNREYYAWHVRDALEPEIFLKGKAGADASRPKGSR